MKRLRKCKGTVAALAVIVLLSFLRGDSAEALTSTGAMGVAVGVNIRCVVASGNLAFGGFPPGVTVQRDAVGSVTIDCTTNANNTGMQINAGLNPAPGSTNATPLRRMRNGTSYLSYYLYSDAAHTDIWNNIKNSEKVGKVFPVTLRVYGRIPAGQNLVVGTYVDSLVVLVSF